MGFRNISKGILSAERFICESRKAGFSITQSGIYNVVHRNVLVDNSVQNLNAAQNVGINTVLFNRDHEAYAGNVVNNFQELDSILKKLM